jgi:signal transduction histidine kinase
MSTHNTQHDNRQRKQQETKELREAYEELMHLDELKSAIISNVSHELRTPMTIAKTALELMKEEEDSEMKSILLEKALDAIRRQNFIIEDLIQTARLMSRKRDLKLEPLDMAEFVNLTADEFTPIISKKKITMKIHLTEDLPKISADEKRLTHVIRNLVGNAIKFTKPGGNIEIEAAKKGDDVEVRISDTGVGIPKDKLSKIFDRFYQIDSSEARSYGGTGLGLAIVKELVEAHGGRITVESEEDKGSTFCFTVQIAKEE